MTKSDIKEQTKKGKSEERVIRENYILGNFGSETKWVRLTTRRVNLKYDWADIIYCSRN